MSTVRVAVLGATGRMGALVLREVLAAADLELVAAISRPESALIGATAAAVAGAGSGTLPIAAPGPGCFRDADVVVDFSTAEALRHALAYVGPRALVTGTTGLDAGTLDVITEQANLGPVLVAANFSTGVTLLADLVARAARALPDHDVEIVESHHRNKRDAPSGTALALGRAAATARGQRLEDVAVHGRVGDTGVRPLGTIGFHALRLGDVVGEHDVWLAGGGERVRLGHVATDRSVFAKGAVRAARWIRGRAPGRYTMRDVLHLD